jgi:hypothetical protein
MSYGLQLLGNARSVRGDQFRRPEFDRQGRIVGHSETDGLSPGKRRNRKSGYWSALVRQAFDS